MIAHQTVEANPERKRKENENRYWANPKGRSSGPCLSGLISPRSWTKNRFPTEIGNRDQTFKKQPPPLPGLIACPDFLDLEFPKDPQP